MSTNLTDLDTWVAGGVSYTVGGAAAHRFFSYPTRLDDFSIFLGLQLIMTDDVHAKLSNVNAFWSL